MNIYVPQSYEAVAELQWLSSTEALIKSSQSSRVLLCITQDALTAGYEFTVGEYRNKVFYNRVRIDVDTWNDAVSSVNEWDMEYIMNKIKHIKEVLEWKQIDDVDEFLYSGHGLISMLFPNDFEYTFINDNNKVVIVRGVMLSGTLNKQSLGISPTSMVHKLEKEYGAKTTVDFVSFYQFLVNHCLRCRGFSIGIEDCIPSHSKKVKEEITKSFMEAQSIENTETDEELRERKINNALNNATSVGQVISKEGIRFDNALNVMVLSGSKGSFTNIAQIGGLLGQQNVEGKRIPFTFGGRTLPHYDKKMIVIEGLTIEQEDEERRLIYESKGFVTHCFMEGLTPQEFFFHAEGGREGVIDTACKTSSSGYIQRKLVKKMEDLVMSYISGVVVNSRNTVVQFNYQCNFDPARLVRVGGRMSFINIRSLAEHLNVEEEWEKWKNKKENKKIEVVE